MAKRIDKGADKTKALENLKNSADFANRLFYQARNLAIEAMLLRLETALLRQGFPVSAEWKESSFGPPTVFIHCHNPKQGSWEYGSCTLHLKRERIQAPDYASALFYSLDSVVTDEYWPRKQPQMLLDFRAAVAQMGANGYLEKEMLKVNYPFDSQNHSIF